MTEKPSNEKDFTHHLSDFQMLCTLQFLLQSSNFSVKFKHSIKLFSDFVEEETYFLLA